MATYMVSGNDQQCMMEADAGPRPKKEGVLKDTEEWAKQARLAIQLRLAGEPLSEIAVKLGYSPTCRANVLRMIRRAIASVYREEAKELVTLECDRLDALQRAVWADAMRGDLASCAMALRICESRRKLLGLDAPQRVVTDAPAVLADDVDWKAMQADPEAMRFADQFARLAERHAKRPEQQAIEATAEDVTDDDDSQP